MRDRGALSLTSGISAPDRSCGRGRGEVHKVDIRHCTTPYRVYGRDRHHADRTVRAAGRTGCGGLGHDGRSLHGRAKGAFVPCRKRDGTAQGNARQIEQGPDGDVFRRADGGRPDRRRGPPPALRPEAGRGVLQPDTGGDPPEYLLARGVGVRHRRGHCPAPVEVHLPQGRNLAAIRTDRMDARVAGRLAR